MDEIILKFDINIIMGDRKYNNIKTINWRMLGRGEGGRSHCFKS